MRFSLFAALALFGCATDPLPTEVGENPDPQDPGPTDPEVLRQQTTFKQLAEALAASSSVSPVTCDYRSIAASASAVPFTLRFDEAGDVVEFGLGFQSADPNAAPHGLSTLVSYAGGRNRLDVSEIDVGLSYRFTFNGFLTENLEIIQLARESLFALRYTNGDGGSPPLISIDCNPYQLR